MTFNNQNINQNNLANIAAQIEKQREAEPKKQKADDLENIATKVAQEQELMPTPTAMAAPPPTTGQRVMGALATPGEALVEAGQRLGQLEQAIPGVMPLARGIVGALPQQARRGLAALQVKGDILPQATPVARTGGRLLGDITGLELGGEMAAPGLAAAKIPGVIGRPAAQALGGALTSPLHPLFGAITAGAGGTALEAAKMAKFLPKLTLGGLGKATSRAYENMKAIGNKFYDDTFAGIGHIKVQLGDETQAAIKNLKNIFPETSQVGKAIKTFEEKPTLEGMHKLKSAIGERESSNIATIRKSGTNPTTDAELPSLTDARKKIAANTRDYLGIISPEKQALYDKAQQHWAQNVVHFKEFPVIRTLLGKRRIAKPGLFREFAEKVIPKEVPKGQVPPEAPTEALRRIVGVPRGVAQTGRILHHRIGGIPLAAWLGIGGVGALGGGDILRRFL